MTPQSSIDPAEKPTPSSSWQRGRWIGAIALVAAGLVWWIWAGKVICEDAPAEARAPVELCRPVAPTDVPVVAVLVMVALLLWPDLSEAGFAGLLTLRRRVSNAEAKTDSQERRTDVLGGQLLAMQARLDAVAVASASASVENTIYFERSGELLERLPDDVRVKGEELRRSAERGPAPAPATVPPGSPPSDGEVVDHPIVELLGLWAFLDELLFLSPRWRNHARALPTEWQARRSRFLDIFADDIQLVREVRNSAAHSQPLPKGAVEEAVEAARALIAVWTEDQAP